MADLSGVRNLLGTKCNLTRMDQLIDPLSNTSVDAEIFSLTNDIIGVKASLESQSGLYNFSLSYVLASGVKNLEF
jgi:hypothetical protein